MRLIKRPNNELDNVNTEDGFSACCRALERVKYALEKTGFKCELQDYPNPMLAAQQASVLVDISVCESNRNVARQGGRKENVSTHVKTPYVVRLTVAQQGGASEFPVFIAVPEDRNDVYRYVYFNIIMTLRAMFQSACVLHLSDASKQFLKLLGDAEQQDF